MLTPCALLSGAFVVIGRCDLGVVTVTPPTIGRRRDDGKPPGGRWRRHMLRLLKTGSSRRRCGYTQRAPAETVMPIMERNRGPALSGKTARSRRRDMAFNVHTHNLMVL